MQPDEPSTLLVVANSARAIAESAVRGGFDVHVLDGFCDEDTREIADCTLVPMEGAGLDAGRLVEEVERLTQAPSSAEVALVYGAGLEPCPRLLAGLQRRVRLMGNDPEILDLLADPHRVFAMLGELCIPHPETQLDPPSAGEPTDADAADWLVKESGTSGGLGVHLWRSADPRPRGPHYFQRRLVGEPMSVLFIADGERHAVIGFNRLLVSDGGPERPFLYGGALGQASLDDRGRQEVDTWCAALVRRLGLRGINGLDFILHRGQPHFLELNARPSASLSLYESQCEEGWICRHVRACLGELPEPDLNRAPRGRIYGQRILYAPHDLEIPVGLAWPDWCHDRPVAGSQIPQGAPVCSVLADANEPVCVEVRLAERLIRVLGLLDKHETRAVALAGDADAGRLAQSISPQGARQ